MLHILSGWSKAAENILIMGPMISHFVAETQNR